MEAAGADAWYGLAVEACDTGAWDHDVAGQLAEGFLAAHGEGSAVTVERMSVAVWLVAVGLCRDRFPQDALDAGPPGLVYAVGPREIPTGLTTTTAAALTDMTTTSVSLPPRPCPDDLPVTLVIGGEGAGGATGIGLWLPAPVEGCTAPVAGVVTVEAFHDQKMAIEGDLTFNVDDAVTNTERFDEMPQGRAFASWEIRNWCGEPGLFTATTDDGMTVSTEVGPRCDDPTGPIQVRRLR